MLLRLGDVGGAGDNIRVITALIAGCESILTCNCNVEDSTDCCIVIFKHNTTVYSYPFNHRLTDE